MKTRRELGAMSATADPADVGSARCAAVILDRAISRACAAPTIQEGLYSVYLRDLRQLLDVELPDDMPGLTAALAHELGRSLGFDGATGRKQRPSTLTTVESRVFLARIQALRGRAESIWHAHITRLHI